MSLPSVVMCSMWRNDLDRNLVDRVEHLLAKAETWPNLRWVWVIGDSTDGTAEALRDLSRGYDGVRVVDIGDTGIMGNDLAARLRRLSVTGNHYFRHAAGADFILIHESDILSPHDLVWRLVAQAERGYCPIAAWPTLEIRPGYRIFYDTFIYRKDGVQFRHTPPYHQAHQPDRPFIVDSAGTVLMFHGADVGEVIMDRRAILDLCWHLRKLGRDIWVDPSIEVVQPHGLWEYHNMREFA